MQEIVVGLAVILLVIAVPQLRRAVLSLLGLFVIIAAGSAVFATFIWTLYEVKPWLKSEGTDVVQQESLPENNGEDSVETAEVDLAAALAGEKAQRLEEEEQRSEEEEKLRMTVLAAKARVILEEDRKLAAQAVAYPLPAGVSDRLGDIMAIRIPAWRDKEVASVQKEAIRTWLKSIGLDTDETVSIVTAKAWGSLYDMWVAENPGVAPPSPQAGALAAASTAPELDSSSDQSDQMPPARSETTEESSPIAETPPPRREITRRSWQRQHRAPRRSTPIRQLPRPEREVGPFGY